MKMIFMQFEKSRGQRGAVLVMVAGTLVMMLAFVAMVVDIGYMFVVRNELQSAADAAALAGAGYMFPLVSNVPNWTAAETQTTNAIAINKVAGAALSNATVESGYWNLTGTPAGLQSKTITPGANDVAAVRVTVSKSAGNNGGPVNLLFARIMGINRMDTAAHAVAVVGVGPTTVVDNWIFPVAISKCLYDSYWSSVNGTPSIDPMTGMPYEFQITNHHALGPCDAAQWTSLLDQDESVGAIRDLLDPQSKVTLKIGDQIWLQNGTKNTLYDEVPIGVDVTIAVVDDAAGWGNWHPVVAIAGFHIDAAVGGSGKYIQGHFVKDYKVGGGEPGGTYYGAYAPPRLAN